MTHSTEQPPDGPSDLESSLRTPPVVDVGGLSSAVVREAKPLLARRATSAWMQRVAMGLALALLPLPVVAYTFATALAAAYGFATAYLPSSVVFYGLGTYAAGVVLMIGATYALIPIALAAPPSAWRWQQT